MLAANTPITEFRNEFSFLSNFHVQPFNMPDGRLYISAEHAFQAYKADTPEDHERIRNMLSPAMAKAAGRKVKLRDDWEQIKLDVMRSVVTAKFRPGGELAYLLYQTGNRELIEGNTWHDYYWGVCNGKGENWLGKILMEVRADLGRVE